MKEKFFKWFDLAILTILFLTLISALFYPPYRNIYSGIVYNFLISFSTFLFIIRYKFSKEISYNETPIDNLLFLLFCWYIFSTIFSINIFNSLNASLSFAVLLAFYYLIHNYAKTFYKNILWFLFIITALLSFYGFYQYFYGFDQTLNYLKNNPVDNSTDIINRLKSHRIFSTFIYPNSFAGFLIMIIPITFSFAKNEKKYRLFLVPLLILFICALLLTKSIGAFISLILSIILVSSLISDKTVKNFKIFLLYFLIILTIIFTFIIKERGPQDFLSNLSSKYLSLIKMTNIASNYLLSGAGPGNFEQVYNALNNTMGYLKYAHNIIMQITIELGLPGTILVLIILYSQYKIILQNFFYLKTPQSKIFIISLLISITSFLIHNLVDFDIYNFELAMIFVLLVAILNSQIIIGTLEIKKIKLIYYLGLNPAKRRSIIFTIIILILGLSAINGAQNIYISTLINILVAIGFSIWSVSKEEIRQTDFDVPILIFIILSLISFFYTLNLYKFTEYFTLIVISVAVFYLYSQFLRRYIYKIIISNYITIIGIIMSIFITLIWIINFFKIQFPLINNINLNLPFVYLYLIITFNFILCKILFEKKIENLNIKIFALTIILVNQFLIAYKIFLFLQFFIFIFIWLYYKKYKFYVKDIYEKELFKFKFLNFLLIAFVIIISAVIFNSHNKTIFNKEANILHKKEINKNILKIITDKPLTGYGIGSYENIFFEPNFSFNSTIKFNTFPSFANNEFLQIYLALGLPGLILLIFIIYLIIKNLPEVGGHRKVWSASIGTYFSLIALIISFFFYNTLHFPGMLITFTVFVSMLSKEKSSIPTIPKESLFFVKIYYFIHIIFSFIIFNFIIRPAVGDLLNTYYERTKNTKYLEYAITIEPLNPKNIFKKGILLEKNKFYEDAIKNYEKVILIEKNNFNYYLSLGRCFYYLNNIETSIRYYEKAIKYNPYNIFTYYELANIYILKLNNLNVAKNFLIKALEYEPNFLKAKHSLAQILKQENNYIAALNQYNEIEEKINKLQPQTQYEKSLLDFPVEILYLNKALIFRDLKNFDQAILYLKKYYVLTKDENIKKMINELTEKGRKN